MRCITSANVACGFHAGDDAAMRQTVLLARDHGVGVGAHPSFADREHFGRREMELSTTEIQSLVIRQIAALAEVAVKRGHSPETCQTPRRSLQHGCS